LTIVTQFNSIYVDIHQAIFSKKALYLPKIITG